MDKRIREEKMKKNTITILISLSLIILLTGCSNTHINKVAKADFESKDYTKYTSVETGLYENEIYGFSIELPIGWEYMEYFNDENTTPAVIFTGPVIDNFPMEIIVKIGKLQNRTLDQIIQALKEYYQQFDIENNYALTDEGKITIGGRNSYFIRSTADWENWKEESKDVILMKEDRAFIITYLALQNNFEDFSGIFDNSLSTFKFLTATKTTESSVKTESVNSCLIMVPNSENGSKELRLIQNNPISIGFYESGNKKHTIEVVNSKPSSWCEIRIDNITTTISVGEFDFINEIKVIVRAVDIAASPERVLEEINAEEAKTQQAQYSNQGIYSAYETYEYSPTLGQAGTPVPGAPIKPTAPVAPPRYIYVPSPTHSDCPSGIASGIVGCGPGTSGIIEYR